MRASEQEELADDLAEAERQAGIADARRRLPSGPSANQCGVCGNDIPAERRQAWPGVQTCVPCQEELDHALSNRRME
jgi:phage/conjugal plasmid C-4 type zinc finger TraR family protein